MASERRDAFLKTASPATISALADWLGEIERAAVEQLVRANAEDFRKAQGRILALRDIRRDISSPAAGCERVETTY